MIGSSHCAYSPYCSLYISYDAILAPVVRRVDNAIHWINLYPVDSAVRFVHIYPLDSDSSIE